jgi:hypothetical protein
MALEYPPATPKKRPGDPETLLAVVVKACGLKSYSECSSISNVECFTGKIVFKELLREDVYWF